MRLLLTTCMLLLAGMLTGQTQTTEPFCATDLLLEKSLTDPAFQRLHDLQESRMYNQFSQAPPRADAAQQVVTLPVVFHIIHDNGLENISDAEVIAALQNLNEAFSNLAYYDQGTGFNTMIQFCLAQRTPDNLATTGITRDVNALTVFDYTFNDLNLKNINRWEPKDYINVWMVREICSGLGCSVAGYAYLPAAHGTAVDGIVLESRWMLNPANVGVLVHEMGHYLGLYHTFQGGCVNNDCLSDGDRVCDTPPDQSTQWVPCSSVVNTCNTDAQSGFTSDQPDMITNFMDYTDFNCFHDFTSGQSDRMNWIVNNTRKSLLESLGCSLPCPGPVTAAFTVQSETNVGVSLQMNNSSTNAAAYQWYINNVPFSTDANPFYFFDQAGQFTITLQAIPADTTVCLPATAAQVVHVLCTVDAGFSVDNLYPAPGETIQITNTSQNASDVEWFVNGISQGNSLNTYTPLTPGLHILRQRAFNAYCEDIHYEYVIARTTQTDTTCAQFWVKTFGLDNFSELSGVLIPTLDGNFYLSGTRNDSTLLMKMTPDGALLWQVSCKLSIYEQELITQIIEDSDGRLVGCGIAYNSGSGIFNGFIFKFDPLTQQVLWNYNSPGSPQTYYFAVVEKTPGGNYVVFNSWHNSPPPGSFDDLHWIEINRNTGAMTTAKFGFSLGTSEGALEAQVRNGRVYTAGRYAFPGSGFEGFRGSLSRFDLQANEQWSVMQCFPQDSIARNYATDFIFDGDFIISLIYGDFSGVDLFTNEFVLASNDIQIGQQVFNRRYTLPAGITVNPRNVVKTDDGYVVLAYGFSPQTNTYLIKTDLTGNVVWAWDYADFQGFRAEKCLAYRDNALYMTGSRFGDICVMKLDPLTGLAGGNCPAPAPVSVQFTNKQPFVQAVDLVRYASPATQVAKTAVASPTTMNALTACAKQCLPEICDNGIDDDGDNLADCLDPDCNCQTCDGQQTRFWYFGDKAGLDFGTDPPTVLTNGQTFSREASAVMSDPFGNLLFYTDGDRVYNRDHQPMPNGFGLGGHPSTTQVLILPQPNKPWRYYVFTPSSFDSFGPGDGLRYSVVDMTLQGGLGDVVPTEKGILLVDFNGFTEKITATRHCNGLDWWVVVKVKPGNTFLAYPLTENGLSAPAFSQAGVNNTTTTDVAGVMKFNPAGNLMVNTLFHSGGFDLLKFDQSNGQFTDAVTITDASVMSGAYGAEFSENGQLLYLVGIYPYSSLHQFNVGQFSQAAITASRVLLENRSEDYYFGQLQRALNNKIYVSNTGPLQFTTQLGVINAPNIPGTGCSYQDGALSIAPGGANIGLPSFPQEFLPKSIAIQISGPDTVCYVYDSIQYTLQIDACSVDSVIWQVSGGATLVNINLTNVVVVYPEPGEYRITALVFSPCVVESDTFRVLVDDSGFLTPDLGPDIALCANSVQVLDPGAGFARYRWNDGSTEPTLTTLFPGKYWVDVWNTCNEQQSDTIVISFLTNSSINAGQDTTVCGAITYHLPPDFVSWSWSPANGLNCTTCSPVTVSLNGQETYIVTAQTAEGCLSNDTFTVRFDYINDTVSLAFCPGDELNIGGQTITPASDTTILVFVPGIAACDTNRLYILDLQPLPTISETLFLCPGDTLYIGGVPYTEPGFVTDTLPATVGCDTIAEYILRFAPIPTIFDTIGICPGDSILIGGTYYSQSGTVTIQIPAAAGCDTVATYEIMVLDPPTTIKTIHFCPGDTVFISGVAYTQPDTVSGIIPAAIGCDTLATYWLNHLPVPSVTRTISFCPGETVVIDGISYSQPGTVQGVLPASQGCDTLATYLLRYATDGQSSVMSLNCPNDIFVDADPGSAGVAVDYDIPTATSDCICPGIQMSLQQGLPPGDHFPVGVTDVCYTARDSCGSVITCCFKVTVTEQTACDVKSISCIRYELLGISQNAAFEKTYRIRVKNDCQQPLVYFAAQLPNALTAEAPANNSTYTAPSGRGYTVRNPNASPFYSIRFMSQADSISGGETDIFAYTLPPQADPDYIHVIVRIKEQIFHEAYLNTFNCPVQYGPIQPPGAKTQGRLDMHLYPNPNDGQFYLDGERKPSGMAILRIMDGQGRLVYQLQTEVGEEPVALQLPPQIPAGLFVMDVRFADGSSWSGRFVKE